MPKLEWIGKKKVQDYDKDVPMKILNKLYSYGEKDSDNMIIHGDNLEVLKALELKYESKIKCIYIDPPYNTGNENWIYNDNVNDPKIKKWLHQVVGKEGEDLSRHDKWLCMMYPRLKLLKNLLKDDGVIFISIDDNEQANLKLICDEIFGASNFVANIIVENDSRARPYNSLSITHEYVLVYRKSINFTAKILYNKNKKFKYSDIAGGFDLYELRNRNSDFNVTNRPNLYYPFWVNPKHKDENNLYEISLEERPEWIKFYPQESQGIKTVWRWGKEKSFQNLNTVIFGKKAIGGWQVVKKYRESSYSLNSVWTGSEFSSDNGTLTLKKYFDNKRIFGFPKSIELIKQLFNLVINKDDIILDSFAGSGTTGHAVLDLNKEDGGKRKFILVEMEDYAETITAERIKRVIDGYGKDDKKVEGLGGGFSFYELGEPIMINKDKINENIPIEKLREYVYYGETRKPLKENKQSKNKYFLDTYKDTAYYFYYEKGKITMLDLNFLDTIDIKSNSYLIFADKCLLDKEDLEERNIVFKKIPRDIKKL
jgi:adenine-specific DNA-methyltransferase